MCVHNMWKKHVAIIISVGNGNNVCVISVWNDWNVFRNTNVQARYGDHKKKQRENNIMRVLRESFE